MLINPSPSYAVKKYFFTLTVGTHARQQSKFTGITSTTSAVTGPGTDKKLVPAISAELVISLTDTLATIDTDRRPEKLIEAM
jgi:hypothetical protein